MINTKRYYLIDPDEYEQLLSNRSKQQALDVSVAEHNNRMIKKKNIRKKT